MPNNTKTIKKRVKHDKAKDKDREDIHKYILFELSDLFNTLQSIKLRDNKNN